MPIEENPVESSPPPVRDSKDFFEVFLPSSATIVGINRRINTCLPLPFQGVRGRSPLGRLEIIGRKEW